MRIISVFDGMACGILAMMEAGIKVDRYVAYEYDIETADAKKGRPYGFAALTSAHNFPMIEHRGDVFQADFTEFFGFDFLIGGSPCTYWSIAQKNNRETEAGGMGWELFCQYVRALHEAKPRWFIYENNKSMSKAIRESITQTFGFEPICINSALVSAQNRQRLYWVGKRNPDGTYSKVHVEQPEDRGILLRDVLDGIGAKELSEREMDYMVRSTNGKYSDRLAYLQKPGQSDKALCITANVSKGVPYNIVAEPVRIPEYGHGTKSRPLSASYSHKGCGEGSLAFDCFPENPNKQVFDYVADPVCVAERGRYSADGIEQHYEARDDGKTNVLTTVQKDNQVCEPVRVGALPRPNGELSTSQAFRVYSADGKSVNITAGGGGAGGKTGLYAIPIEFDGDVPTKAISGSDGKTYTVYQVKDGQITIKGKSYPIKLADGFYIIRKLTVSECKRLQTVPEWYEFPVSDTQAYKMLGNGWTVLIISHLIQATQADELEEPEEQISLFKEVSYGRY